MMISSTDETFLLPPDLKIVERCEAASPTGFCSVGVPPNSFQPTDVSNGLLFWFPLGTPSGDSISIASSRLSQKLDEHGEWFDALRTATVQISQKNRFLISSRGTTADPFLKRIAELLGIPLLEFERFPARPGKAWFNERTKTLTASGQRSKCYFKPLEKLAAVKFDINELLIGIAHSVYLLSVRKNGNVFASACARLDTEHKSSTRLLINSTLTPSDVESDLLEAGATAWWIYDHHDSTPGIARKPRQPIEANVLSLDEIKTDGYFVHWTRRRVGPWPDQSKAEYLDDLIFRNSRRGHNQVSSLCRILASQRILGSNDLTRDSRDVVCFSDLPLDKILPHRVFRPHLSRWDFEPYGIAIERDLLKQLGARRVIYGSETQWNQIPPSDRAFFQLANSKATEIDWTIEREWRIIGDLKLNDIPVNQALVFVKTQSDAELVAGLSRWPIVILG